MKIPKFAVTHPVTTIMAMFLILILGFVSFTNLKLDLMPNINPPVIAVITTYPGAGPQEVKEMVTKPVEDVVSTTQGLKSMQSQSISNSSMVIAQFDWGTNISEIREDLSSKLDRVNLAEGIDSPMLVKFDPTMMPIMDFAVTTGESLDTMQSMVEKELTPQLQNIEGVASVSVSGGHSEEIVVALNQEKLTQYKLTQDKIVQLLQANNLTYPGGMINSESEILNLRILGEVTSIEALKLLPVSIIPQGSEMKVINLAEVAEVKYSPKNVKSMARSHGKNSLVISVQKEGTANTAEVTAKVREKLEDLEKENTNLEFAISSDQGEIVERSVGNVSSALLYGALFAIIVILFFLRSVGATLIVGIAIPFSVIATFVLMYFADMSLNIMSLGGLALGVGMLVDNAIVVIENIYRHLSLNKSNKEAAIDGSMEVAAAVASSTLTTIAVFLPVVFIGGMVGDIFKELALTVTFSLVSSLVVALTVVPTLAGLLLKPGKVKVVRENRVYKALITWALRNRFATLLLATMVLAGSIYLIPQIGTEFMPTQDEGMFSISVKLPEGSNLDSTLQVVKELEEEILKIKEVDVTTSVIGSDGQLASANAGGEENTATINVKLVDGKERSKATEEIMKGLEERVTSISEKAKLNFNISNSMMAMGGNSSATEVILVGRDQAKINEYAKELKKRLENIKGITEVYDSIEVGKPEFQFIIDKEKAFQKGLTTNQVASFVNQSIQGKVATKLSNNGVEKDVRVLISGLQNSKESIENLVMTTPSGQQVLLKEIGTVARGESPVTIVRQDQQDSVTITANFEDTDLGTVTATAQSEIDDLVGDLKIDTDLYTIQTTGGAEMMGDAFSSLQLAMLLAVVFVYMIMASQFESLVHPLIIMFTLPLAITGVSVGLYTTGYSFGITAFIGIIILVGIVVNNAIIYVDYTNQLIKAKTPIKEALIKAGLTRLRPILMTAITTMLGLLPLAIGVGEGADIQAPMAIAVIGGLFTSTVLTLIVIPVLYSLVESVKLFRKKWKLAMEKMSEAEKELEINY